MAVVNLSIPTEFLTYVELLDSPHCIPTAFWIVLCNEDDCAEEGDSL